MKNKKTAVVTGASGGLGLSLAKQLAAKGYNTILVARNKQKLSAISQALNEKFPVQSVYYVCDLQSKEEIDRLVKQVIQEQSSIDIIINNAGISNFGEFAETTMEDDEAMLQLNINAMLLLTRRFIPKLMSPGNAKILNVASVVGHYPLPYQAVYAASKAFVISFSQALAAELEGEGIQVSCLCPGNIKTGFIRSSGLLQLYSKMKSNARIEGMEPDEVAVIAIDQMLKGKRMIYPDKKLKRGINIMKWFSTEKLSDKQYKNRKEALGS